MEPTKKRRFLFLHANDATPRRNLDKSLDSKIRRHLMVDIGKARRKLPSEVLPFEILVWPVKMSVAQAGTSANSSSRDDHAQAPTKVSGSVAPYAASPSTAIRPIIHALSIFEREWGEDMFSAYGFALIMVAGENAMHFSMETSVVREIHSHRSANFIWHIACSTNTFWFPFAFKKSAFLHHYQQLLASPDVLAPLYLRSAGELRSLALQRSLETIQCVESRLASADASSATSDDVLDAVLAMICYNVSLVGGEPD